MPSSLILHFSWADTVEKHIGVSARSKGIAYTNININGVLFDIAFPPVKERVPFEAELIRQADADASPLSLIFLK